MTTIQSIRMTAIQCRRLKFLQRLPQLVQELQIDKRE